MIKFIKSCFEPDILESSFTTIIWLFIAMVVIVGIFAFMEVPFVRNVIILGVAIRVFVWSLK